MEKDIIRLLRKMDSGVDRLATATEKMVAIAEREEAVFMEPGPSVCPHCGTLNPEITQLEADDGSGPIDTFVLIAETHCCNKTVFAVPVSLAMLPTVELAKEMLRQKGGKSNANGS